MATSIRMPGGLTLLVEPMRGVSSAAMSLVVPAGTASDPAGAVGSAVVVAEWVMRGAGSRDSRQLTDHLDHLGLHRSSGAGLLLTRFSAVAPAPRLLDALPAYADILRRPKFEQASFEPSVEQAIQAIDGLEDDPRSRVLIRLRQEHWPAPFGRSNLGQREDLEALTPQIAREVWSNRYRGGGAVLAIAGAVEVDDIRSRVEPLLGDFDGHADLPDAPFVPGSGLVFVESPSEQTHIGIAWASVPEDGPDYYPARLAAEVLSGNTSARLFTEIREKRALCYSVSASYASVPGGGSMLGYAGTTPDRAQATLDQFIREVHRLHRQGATADELNRCKTGLKANILMSGESTRSRASALTHDWVVRKRPRSLEEIRGIIDAITLERVNDHLRAYHPRAFQVVVVGPKPLEVGNESI